MGISLQLVELPENEQVTSRQISLPDSGGTIGRSFDCTVQLPDFNRTLSRVHAEIVLSPKGTYQLIDRSTNGVYVNGQLLGKGVKQNISDGDNIKLGAYTLLVSDMDSLFVDQEDNAPQPDEPLDASMDGLFDVQNLDAELSSDSVSKEKSMGEKSEKVTQAEAFSKSNVMGEDVFSYDPFEDMQSDLEMKEEKTQIPVEEVEIAYKEPKQEVSTYNLVQAEERKELHDSIARLNQIIEQQQNVLSGSIAHDRLMACLESTFDKFIQSFNPTHLEEEFNDYLSGWGARDKKYWSLYKKQFLRKQERGEYYRQFYALLFEELREKR